MSSRIIATPRQQSAGGGRGGRARAGITAHMLSDEIEGESREVGRVHAALARSVARHGEPFAEALPDPVRRRNDGDAGPAGAGRGGRAGEFLLGCAIALEGQPEVWGLAADTDGIDGVEDNAGAFLSARAPWSAPARWA